MGFLSGFKSAVKSVGKSVKNAVTSTAKSVKSAVLKTASSVYEKVKSGAEGFKKDVLSATTIGNTIKGAVSGAVTGFISGGPTGAIAGAITGGTAGAVEGREMTRAERKALREAESGDVVDTGSVEYSVESPSINVGEIVQGAISSAINTATSGASEQAKYNNEHAKRIRYDSYTDKLELSKAVK